MFEEEEEQQQDVAPLEVALKEAAAAAEAQGRSRQPGQATATLGHTSSFCFLPDPLPYSNPAWKFPLVSASGF